MKNDISEIYLIVKANGLLYLINHEKEVEVTPKACFPMGSPNEFISLINSEGKEVFLVGGLTECPKNIRDPLLKYLRDRHFNIEITRIIDIKEDYQLRIWEVETKQGKRKFQAALKTWPRKRKNNTYVIEDLSGDIYSIVEKTKLDKKSIKLISPFVD